MQTEIVFCDQVRLENNGKHFLIGVYPGDVMTATQIPGTIHVSVWLKVRDLPVGFYNFEMTYQSRAALLTPSPFYGTVQVSHAGLPATMYSGPASIPISESGAIEVRLRMTNSNNQVVCDQTAGTIYVVKPG